MVRLIHILFAGILIRLALAPFFAHPFDIYAWYSSVENASAAGGPLFVVSPMMSYTLYLTAILYTWLGPLFGTRPTSFTSLPSIVQSSAGWTIPLDSQVPVVPDPVFNMLVKLPFMFSDLAAGLLLYSLVSKHVDPEKAQLVFGLWFLNPMLIWISAVWGMFDSLPALFTIATIYLLLEKRTSLSGICLGIATGYKLYPILFTLPILLYMRRAGYTANGIRSFIQAYALSSILIFAPFTLEMFNGTTQLLSKGANPWESAFGLTYWTIAPILTQDTQLMTTISNTLLLILFTASFLLILRWKAPHNLAIMIFQMELVLGAVFLSYRIIPEQFFVWLLPFLALDATTAGRGRLYLLSLLALFYSWANSLLFAFATPLVALTKSKIIEQLAEQSLKLSGLRIWNMAILGTLFSAALAYTLVQRYKVSASVPAKTIPVISPEPAVHSPAL